MLKNSTTLAVSFPINLSFKLRFAFVNGHRETFFVDALRMYLGKIWNLIQGLYTQSSDWMLYISTPLSSFVENLDMEFFCLAGDRTPDPLNQKQTCYHLSQRGLAIKSYLLELLHKQKGKFHTLEHVKHGYKNACYSLTLKTLQRIAK